jgi:hypothetical protein
MIVVAPGARLNRWEATHDSSEIVRAVSDAEGHA